MARAETHGTTKSRKAGGGRRFRRRVVAPKVGRRRTPTPRSDRERERAAPGLADGAGGARSHPPLRSSTTTPTNAVARPEAAGGPLRIQVECAPLPPSTHTCAWGGDRAVWPRERYPRATGLRTPEARVVGAVPPRSGALGDSRDSPCAPSRLRRVRPRAGSDAPPATSFSVSGVAFSDCPGTSYSASEPNRPPRGRRHFSSIDNALDIRGPV
jgi:hypothetical protein